jgi:hypothetical protein
MKKSIFSVLVLALVTLISTNVAAQEFSGLDKSPMDQATYPSDYKDANKMVKVTYSRPQLKDRPVSKLAPNGAIWRTGANEAAEITLYQDMMLGKKLVKKGTYTMYTIPGEKSWTTILSTDLNVWGSYFYNEKNDVVRISSEKMKADDKLEAFSIAFTKEKNDIAMFMGWGNLRIKTVMTAAQQSAPVLTKQ